jgi:serine/threonine protein kinase
VTAPQLAPGQVVAGKYSIRARLGYGGATATYTAAGAPGHEVVIKLYSPQLAARSDVLSALQAAVAGTNALPAEVAGKIVESGFDPDTRAPFVVTDVMPIPSLAQTVQLGPMPLGEVALLVTGMARAVDAAHAQRLVHGGLKPQNVFVGAAPQRPVRVIDFGVAIARAALPTGEGQALAAPWMAPEQAQGIPHGPAADVFSAGLVAFFAATGRSYWRSCQGPTPDLAGWQQEVTAPRVPASARAQELGAALGPAFDLALGRALSSNPAERFGSVGELAEALTKASATQKMAMTMPLNAMPLADLQRLRQAAAKPAAPAPQFSGGDTLAIQSPLEAAGGSWPQSPAAQPVPQAQAAAHAPSVPPTQAAPQMQPMQQPMQQAQVPQGPAPQAPIATPYGGFQAGAPAPPQGGYQPQPQYAPAQPSYAPAQASYGPPPESVVLPMQRKTGLYVTLGLVGLAVLVGAIVLVVVLARHGTGTSPVASQTPSGVLSAPPPPGSTTAATTTAPPPVDAQDAQAPSTATPEAAAPAAGTQDAGSPELAELTIVCVPECDAITVDDKALDGLDAGPLAPLQLSAGAHTVVAGKATFVTQTKKVTLKAGQKEKATFFLAKPGPAPSKPCGKFLERCP